jgi:hypothetical protein
VDVGYDYLALLSFFVLSSWFPERLPVSAYLSLVGPPESGKSTALRVLGLLCRRSLLTTDFSSAAFHRACELFKPTILIDETATAGNQRALFHLLRAGSTPDFVTLRRHESFRCYGVKAVTWLELPNDSALNSRSIIIPMRESCRNDLLKPNDPGVLRVASRVQQALLNFRLEELGKLRVPSIPAGARLHARRKDLFQALGLPVSGNSELLEVLTQCFETHVESSREVLSPRKRAVLRIILATAHGVTNDRCLALIKGITENANLYLRFSGERIQLSEREVGGILMSLGVGNRHRTNQGWAVPMDRALLEYIHRLAAEHGIEDIGNQTGGREACEFCSELRNGDVRPSADPAHTKASSVEVSDSGRERQKT